MKVSTDSERVRLSRRVVLEFLAYFRGSLLRLARRAPVDGALRRATQAVRAAGAAGRRGRPHARPCAPRAPWRAHGRRRDGGAARQSGQRPVCARLRALHPLLQMRAGLRRRGPEHLAIAVAGRGFDARISTELATPLPESACVYCGNCIGVCPTGALMFKTEHDLRQAGRWTSPGKPSPRRSALIAASAARWRSVSRTTRSCG